MDEKEIEKVDTETGGIEKDEKTSVGKDQLVSLDYLNKYFEEFKKDVDKLKKENNLFKKNTEIKLEKKLDEYDKKSEDRQIKAIEALGIFVALFSFISVSIQIFNRISSSWSAGFFVLLIFCALSIMIILLDLLLIKPPDTVKDFFNNYRFYLILLFVIIGAVSVVSLRYFPLNTLPGTIEFEDILSKKVDDKINILINERSYQKIDIDRLINESKKETKNFKDCIWNNGLSPCLK